MSTQSLGQYFETVVGGAQEFIDGLPDEFLHESNKTAYQLINEINVYLRSGSLTKKEYTIVTRKTEALIEEIEKLEIAYESRKGDNDTDDFAKDFKNEFQEVMKQPTWKEHISTYLGWTVYGATAARTILHAIHVPVLLAIMFLGIVVVSRGLVSDGMIFMLLLTGVAGMGIVLFTWLLRFGRIPTLMGVVLIGWFL